MRARLATLVVLACAVGIGIATNALIAHAAPALQLPWPTGVQHRIYGGDTYGCGYHTGSSYYAIDFQFAIGNDVSAVASGTVSARDNVGDIRGNFVEIDHGGGYRTRYLHLNDWVAGLNVGTPVAQGDLIGHSGDTGNVAPHLHFDLKLNGSAYKAEPMSGVPGPGENEFGWYGYSKESGLGDDGRNNNINDPSPYWTSEPPCPGGGPWSAWQDLGGVLNSGPGVSSWDCGRLDVFALGTDNKLRHKYYESPTVGGAGSWLPAGSWENLGPSGTALNSDPAAVSWSDGRIDVFVRASGNAIWHRWYIQGTGWSGWESLGGVLNSGPGVSSWAEGRLDVFALDTNNKLRHKYFVQGQGWSGSWGNLGAPSGLTLTSDPGVVSWGYDRIDVFARASDNRIWHRWFVRGQGWSNWVEELGGTLNSGPGVSSWAEDRLDVFALDTYNHLRQKYFTGQAWHGWVDLGEGLTLTSDPDAVSWGYRRIDVFIRGSDNHLWHRWY